MRLFLHHSLFVFVLLATVSCASASVTIDPNSNFSKDAKFDRTIDFENPDYTLLNEAVFHATNEARASGGRNEVTFHKTLAKASQRYAKRQALRNFLAHEDPTGGPKKPADRVIAAGAINPFIAENLATAAGYPIESGEKIYVRDNGTFARTPDGPSLKAHSYRSFARDVVVQWLNSPGHRKNLLSKDALELGTGVYIFFQGDMPSFVAIQMFQLYEPLE